MQHSRREFSALLGGLLGALALPAETAVMSPAGDFPNQPIRFISPFPPGGGNDFHMRLVSNELTNVVGQSVVAENRGGAGGNIGTKYVAEAKADGYTVLTSQVSIMAVNPALYTAPGFDPVKSFLPITQINAAPLAIVVAADSPLKTLADLRSASRSRSLTYATPGNGTLSHLLGVVLEKDAGIPLTHVPYRGAAPALVDVMGGQVNLMITSTSSVAGHVTQGKLRALAVSSARRVGVFKETPTMEDQGFRDMSYDDWYGFFVPGKTPRALLQFVNVELRKTLADRAISEPLLVQGAEAAPSTPEELTRIMREEHGRWLKVIKAQQLKL